MYILCAKTHFFFFFFFFFFGGGGGWETSTISSNLNFFNVQKTY